MRSDSTIDKSPCNHTPALHTHHTRPVTFTLVVDDFGIKYHSKNDAFHLLSCLRELYEIITDWSDSLYIGFTLKLNYSK